MLLFSPMSQQLGFGKGQKSTIGFTHENGAYSMSIPFVGPNFVKLATDMHTFKKSLLKSKERVSYFVFTSCIITP